MISIPTLSVHPASAVYPGFTHAQSVQLLHKQAFQAPWGSLDLGHIQLCPQHKGSVNEALIDQLCTLYPDTRFRLHANVRLMDQFGLFDASTPWDHPIFTQWRGHLKTINDLLQRPVYSWHAGRSRTATLQQAIDQTQRLQEYLQAPCAIEGLYPSREGWLMSCIADYAYVFEHSDVYYALDLSHWKICVMQQVPSDHWHFDLLQRMLLSERCLEVHVSDNDGIHDAHQKMKQPHWQHFFQQLQPQLHSNTRVFSEALIRTARSVASQAPLAS